MPAVTRDLSVVYGSTTVGGSSDTLLNDRIQIDREYASTTVRFQAVIAGTASDAAFATACSDLEAAFRTPRQRLRVLQGASTLLDFNPDAATNTGYNAAPSISKVGGDADTGRSRVYDISVSVETPADLSGQSGRRDSQVTVEWDASRRRTITITGSYTASGSNSATAQYTAAIATYATSVLGAFTGTYEIISENTQRDDTNKNLSFTRVYRELLYNQASGTLNDSRIVELTVTYSQQITAPGDSVAEGDVARLIDVVANFSCNVDADQTTDLVGLYNSTIREYVIAQVEVTAGLTASALVDETLVVNEPENSMTGSVTLKGVGSSSILMATYTSQLSVSTGISLIPMWDDKPYSYYEYYGPVTRRITNTISRQYVEGFSPGMPADPQPAANWKLLSSTHEATIRRLGRSGRIINIVDETDSKTWQFVEIVHNTSSKETTGGARRRADPMGTRLRTVIDDAWKPWFEGVTGVKSTIYRIG